MAVALPAGFVLDSPGGDSGALPPGFVVDPTAENPAQSTLPAPVRAFIGMGAGLTQRGVGAIQAGADFVGAKGVSEAAGKVKKKIDYDVKTLGTAGEVGRTAGDIAPVLAIPGGAATMAERAALSGIAGGIEGVTRAGEDTSRSQRAGQGLSGIAAGVVAGPVLEKAAQAAVATKSTVGRLTASKGTNVAEELVGKAAKAAGNVNVTQEATNVRNILSGQHDIASKAENEAWSRVRAEAAGKSVPYAQVPDIQNVLMDAQAASGHPILNSQLTALNRFVDAGLDVPAETIVRMRQGLSKASTKDAGLRDAVAGMDDIIAQNLKVKSLPEALSASRTRFSKFVDQEAVAKAIAEDATPKTVGHVLLQDKAQAADVFDQVLKAAGSKAATAKSTMQRGMIHNLIQGAIKNYAADGTPIVAKDAIVNAIYDIRQTNPELWAKFEPRQQKLMLQLAADMKKSLNGNMVQRVTRFGLDILAPKLKVAEAVAGQQPAFKASEVMKLPKVLDMLNEAPVVAKAAKPFVAPVATGTAASRAIPTREGANQAPPAVPAILRIPVGPSHIESANEQSALSDDLVDRIVRVESNGKQAAKNPNSSAFGVGQFIKSTWLSLMKDEPEAKGKTPREILALRSDPAVSRRMVAKYADNNAKTLRSAGATVTPGTIYLSHFLDGPVAAKLARADPAMPVARIVSKDAIASNPSILRGKKVADVLAWANRKMAT